MKSIFTTLLVLMAVAVSSAHYICGSNYCSANYSCIFDGHYHSCNLGCGVTLQQSTENQWYDDNYKQHFVQVKVSITNHGPTAVNMVVIGAADGSLNLRDNASIWNIECIGNDLTLPSHSSTLKAGQTFNFGYINRGYNAATLYIKNVHVL